MADLEHELDLSAFTAAKGSVDWHKGGKDAKGNMQPAYLTGLGSFGWVLLSEPYTAQAGNEITATATGLGVKKRGNVFMVLGDDVSTGDGGGAIPPKVTAPTVLLNSASTGIAGTTSMVAIIPEGHDEAVPVHFGLWAPTADSFHLASATLTIPEYAEPEPEPGDDDDDDPLAALATALAPRVAKYVGRRGDQDTIDIAEGQVPIVAEFVRGYTRGNGWTDDEPTAALRAAIVSATARLVLNPEQVRQYAAADYSETPALMVGFTLAERHVLDRYRQRWA